MSESVRSLLLWIHLIFIAVWVGSQVLAAFAVIPSVRRVQDREDRVAALRLFTRKFNHLAWGSLAVIVITGGVMTSDSIDTIKAITDNIYDLRWGWIFSIKMTLVIVMAGLVAIHAFVLGPRLLELNQRAVDQVQGGETRIRALQIRSGIVAALGLVISLLVLGCGAFLANRAFSLVAS
jgi:uncharacterized membrane protein